MYAHDYTIIFNYVDTARIHNVGSVYPGKFVRRQFLFNGLHGEMYGILFIESIEDHIVFKSFNPEDIILFQPNKSRILLDENFILTHFIKPVLYLSTFTDTLYGLVKPGIGNGLHKIIGHLIIERFDCIFLLG